MSAVAAGAAVAFALAIVVVVFIVRLCFWPSQRERADPQAAGSTRIERHGNRDDQDFEQAHRTSRHHVPQDQDILVNGCGQLQSRAD